MAIRPPEVRLWWKEPIHGIELAWIVIAFVWGLIMFFMMIWWHGAGKQNLSSESYRTTPERFMAQAQAMIDQHTVREVEGLPVVRPPAGSDVFLIGRLWQWYPLLELKKNETYRLHIASVDWQHGFSLQPVNINLQIHPGYDFVVTVTPDRSGEYTIVCNEFCGIGHHMMTGKIWVTD